MTHFKPENQAADAMGAENIDYIELVTSNTSYPPEADGPFQPLHEAVNHLEDPDDKLPLGKAIKKYPKIATWSVSLMVVVLGWGYDSVVVGSITGVESFQQDYGEEYNRELIIPALWLSLWTASMPIGMTLGSIFAGWFQDRVGRRMSLFTGSSIMAAAAFIIVFSYMPPDLEVRRAMFFVGKVIQGFSIGLLKTTAMTYISETAPTCLRGSALALVPTGNLMGQFLGSIVVFISNNAKGKAGYLGAFGSQFILGVVPFIVACLMPESPAYLSEKRQDDKALRAAERLYAPKADHYLALEKIRASIAEEKSTISGATFLTCFHKDHIRRTMIVVLANFFPTMFGLDLLSKSSYFMQLLGMASSTSLLLLIGGIVAGIAANGVGVWVMSRVGRRPSAMISLSIATVLWAGMGISGFWRGTVVINVTAALLMLIIVTCGLGVWPASYAIMGETSSLRLRAKTQAIGAVGQQATSVLMSFVLPYTYNPDAGNLGGKTGFVLAGLCAIACGLCWFCIPEMKGRTSMEIDQMFDMNLKTREFKHWKRSGAS